MLHRKMDKIRVIKVKDERLQRIRTELRKLIDRSVYAKRKELLSKKKRRERNKLGYALKKSILYCKVCGSYESDMAYIPRIEG